jgi:hypothetical protein
VCLRWELKNLLPIFAQNYPSVDTGVPPVSPPVRRHDRLTANSDPLNGHRSVTSLNDTQAIVSRLLVLDWQTANQTWRCSDLQQRNLKFVALHSAFFILTVRHPDVSMEAGVAAARYDAPTLRIAEEARFGPAEIYCTPEGFLRMVTITLHMDPEEAISRLLPLMAEGVVERTITADEAMGLLCEAIIASSSYTTPLNSRRTPF